MGGRTLLTQPKTQDECLRWTMPILIPKNHIFASGTGAGGPVQGVARYPGPRGRVEWVGLVARPGLAFPGCASIEGMGIASPKITGKRVCEALMYAGIFNRSLFL